MPLKVLVILAVPKVIFRQEVALPLVYLYQDIKWDGKPMLKWHYNPLLSSFEQVSFFKIIVSIYFWMNVSSVISRFYKPLFGITLLVLLLSSYKTCTFYSCGLLWLYGFVRGLLTWMGVEKLECIFFFFFAWRYISSLFSLVFVTFTSNEWLCSAEI